MGIGKKEQTVGYRYFMGLHMVWCAGPVDAVRKITAGDRVAWSGSATASTQIEINAPELFGGEEKEGGLAGAMDIMMGEPTQAPNSYLLAKLGAPLSAFRGVVSTVFRQGLVSANNAYIKPHGALLRRIVKGWQGDAPWYTAKAAVDLGDGYQGMNPAHIVYEAMTNAEWGMGYSAGIINDLNFRAAADTFHAEGLGLCLQWLRQTTIEEFIQLVLDHAGANLVQSRTTGLFELRLLRGGYSTAGLPLFNESNILRLESYQRPAIPEATNEIVLAFKDVTTGKEGSVTVQNLANITAQGGVVSSGKDYPGIPTAALASRVAMRDLRAVSTPLAKARFQATRAASGLQPGDVILFSWSRLGVATMPMRVLSVGAGTLADGAVTVDAAEDVFGMPATSYAAQQPVGWTNPANVPAAAAARVVREAHWFELVRELGATGATALADDAGYLVAAAVRPSSDAIDFGLLTRAGSAAYAEGGRGAFVPAGRLSADMTRGATTATLVAGVDLDLVTVGRYGQIDSEIVRLDAINTTTGAITIGRGVLGTVAAPHTANAWLLFLDSALATDGLQRMDGEAVDAKIVPATGLGELAEALAPVDVVTMDQLAVRPYAPGRLRINGQAYPATVADRIRATWAHRDRLAQNLEGDESTNIGPELGTTYTAQLLSGATVVAEQTGITGTTWSAVPAAPGTYSVRLLSERDGLASAQQHDVPVIYSGAAVGAEPNLRAAFQTSRDTYPGSVWWRFILPDSDYIDVTAEGASRYYGFHNVRKFSSAGVLKGGGYVKQVNSAAFDASTGLFMLSVQELGGVPFWASRLWVFDAAASLNDGPGATMVGPGGGARLEILPGFPDAIAPIWADMAAGHIIATSYNGTEIAKYNATTGAVVASLSGPAGQFGARPQTDGTTIVLTGIAPAGDNTLQLRAFSNLASTGTISLPWRASRAHLLAGSVIAVGGVEARRYTTGGTFQGTLTGITDPANVPQVRAQQWGRYVAIGNGNGAVFDTAAGWASVPDSSYTPP